MDFQEFLVPTDLEIQETTGFEPRQTGAEPWVRSIQVGDRTANLISIEWDVINRSISLLGYRAGSLMLTLSRDGAIRMEFQQDMDVFYATVQFAGDNSSGILRVSLVHDWSVVDQMLL